MSASASETDEADQTEGTPHPRHATAFFGNPDAERQLLDAYRGGRLPHAIILGGPAGIGKATLAWRLARFILVHPDPGASGLREAQTLAVAAGGRAAGQVAALAHPDLSLLRREVNEKSKRFFTEIRADDVRRAIQLFQRASGAGGYRICIVDSAEDLNRSSANALLKLIEEPPPKSLFLLVAHRPGLVLPTIRSRARLMRLQPLTPADIVAVLRTLGSPWIDHSAEELAQAASHAQGSVHDALRLLGSRGIELDALVHRLLDRLPAVDWREVHRLADQVGGRDGEVGFGIAMAAIYDWLGRAVAVRAGRGSRPGAVVPLAEAWEKVAAGARETEALNLDKRPLILGVFSDLATAVRLAG